MLTTLERTTITHAAAISAMLATVARQWPTATSDRDLMIRLRWAKALRRCGVTS